MNMHGYIWKGADVTSGLSDEPITVGVALCDSLTNSGPLRRHTGIRRLPANAHKKKWVDSHLVEASFGLIVPGVDGMLQEKDNVHVWLNIVFL